MAKKKETVPDISSDFKKVKLLWDEGKLENTLAKLDPKDLGGSIKKVPKELIRLMTYLLLEVEDVDDKVKVLKPEQRIPIASLLDLARKNKGLEFSQALAKRIGVDEKISKELGFVFRKQKDKLDIKIDNSITKVISRPSFILTTRRLFTLINFMRYDDILLQVNADIDDLLGIVASILYGATGTLKTFQENAKGIKPEIYIDSCREYLRQINNYSTFLSGALNELEKSLVKTKKRKKVKSRVATRTSKTKKKNKVKSKNVD